MEDEINCINCIDKYTPNDEHPCIDCFNNDDHPNYQPRNTTSNHIYDIEKNKRKF